MSDVDVKVESAGTAKRGRPKGSKDKTPRKRSSVPSKTATAMGKSFDMNVNAAGGDNAKFMMINMQLFNLPDFNLYADDMTVEKVESRLNEFFKIFYEADVKPTVAGMAMALGLSRQNLLNIINDRAIDGGGYGTTLRSDLASVLKKGYKIMENFWEIYMNSGKVNPVTGIFLGKNNFGYADKTEHVLTPNTKQDEDYDIDEIKERYQISTDERLSLTDSQSDQK